ncbi:putative ribonuclease H-like domain-containing protein [Tanacetum coccineum]
MTESPLVDSGFAVPVFSPVDDPIAYLNKAMAFLTVVASLRVTMQQVHGRQGEGHMARQCTQPKRPRNAAWYKDKAMLAEAQEAGQILDEEQFTEDLDTYDSDCDDLSNAQAVLMANISNYVSDVISEENVQDTHLQAQQDSMILSVIEQMSKQMINHVNNWEKANKEQNNESVTAELERYKERVKNLEQHLNIDLSSREKMIDSQMDDMIKEKLALKEQVDSLEQNLSKQINEKECLLQTFTVFKSESKEKEDKYMENEIDLEKKIKKLDNILFKAGYQNPFYLRKAQRIKPILYDGIFISDKHDAMCMINDEETLILEEKSRSKILSKDFGKRFTPQQEMDYEQAFWVRISNPTSKPSDASPVKIEAPKEVPKAKEDPFNWDFTSGIRAYGETLNKKNFIRLDHLPIYNKSGEEPATQIASVEISLKWNKDGIDDLDIDDLYNNLKVFKADIKGSSGSSSNSQMWPFSLQKTLAAVMKLILNGVSTASGHNSQRQASSSSYTDDLMFSFFANQLIVHNYRDLLCNVLFGDNALIVQDGLGYDWSYIAQDEPTEFALMAYTSNSSGSDTKLVVHQKNEAVYEEKIAVLEFEVKDKRYGDQLNENDSSGSELFNSVFDSRSSDGDDNQTTDRFKKDNGYHVVPPPLTVNYMPPLADLSFTRLDDSVYRPTTNKTSASVSQVEKSTSQTSNTNVEMPRVESVRPSRVIIEDWVSDDDEDIFQSNDLQATEKPSFKRIEFTNARNESVKPKQAEKYRIITQNPKVDRRDWNGKMTQKLGLGFGFTKKACFVCGSYSHLIKDCDFHEKRMTKKSVLKNMEKNTGQREIRPFLGKIAVSAVKENGVTTVKASAGCVWRPKMTNLNNVSKDNSGSWVSKRVNYIDPQGRLKQHTREQRHLNDIKTLMEGFGCQFVEVLEVNVCKKNSIFSLKTECLVLSPDFKSYLMQPILLSVSQERNLVRGSFLSKNFENDHTMCFACQKDKKTTKPHVRFSWVFFLASKDETSGILKRFITEIENQLNHKVKVISVARTPQQNRVAERKNRTLIEAARTMLADSLLPTVFWAEAVNTACYDKYVGEILKKFGFSNIRTVSTPIETNKALTKDEDGESKFQVQPKVSHLNAVKRIFRYLKGRPKLGLWYPKDSPFILEAFSDSDYAGASLDRKSTTGGCQFLGSRLISWQCKKQTVVANSTTEAEYIAASHCCGQVLWIQNQMLDYGYNFMQTKIHVDNESAICVVKNPVYHSKTKHIEIRHHFIRDSYEKRLIEMVKIHTDNNVADLLTKAFDGRLMVYKNSGLYTSTNWIEVGSVERAITTVASLDAAQDSDNIIRTQATAMPNVDIPQGINTDGIPRRQETIGGTFAHTRSEKVLEKPNEPPLSEGHTSGSGKGKTKHQFELTTNVLITPHDLPLIGGYTLGSDDVKRLERQRKSSNSQPRRRKYRQFESSDDDLDEEDASKQGRGSDKIKPILCNFTLCLWTLEAKEESTMEFELIKIIKSMLEE